MSIVEQKQYRVLPLIDIPPFGRGLPVRMPTAPGFLSHLLYDRDLEVISLPPMLTPFAAFLEYEQSEVSRRMEQIRTSYIDSYRCGDRQYNWETVISYLHVDQIGTRLPDIVSSMYDGVGDVLGAFGQRTFTSHGGERRRLELRDIVQRDCEHPHVLRAFAGDLLAVPTSGNQDSAYEQCARAILSRLIHPYNKDIKVPLPVHALPMVRQAVVDRITLTLEALHDCFSTIRDGEDVIIHIPQWRDFWAAPRVRAEVPVNVLQLQWDEKHLVMYPQLNSIGGYVIRIHDRHQPDGNSSWRALYIQGGIVDASGEYIHLNLESYVSPEATEDNGLGEVDERSGPCVSSYQRDGVVFDTNTRMVTLPMNETHRFRDTLPDPLPRDIDKLLGLLNRQVQYYALTVEQNDKRRLIENTHILVRTIARFCNHQSISHEKAEQTMQTMALAFLQAPNALLEFFRESGLSAVFPRAARLDTKERMASLDRLDACFPTTQADPRDGSMSWRLDELGLYLAIVHASKYRYPTRMTKRSLMAEFCWYFDPRASIPLGINLKRQNGKTKV